MGKHGPSYHQLDASSELASTLPGQPDEDRERLLLEISNILTTKLDPELLFNTIADVLHSLLGIDRASLALYDNERDAFEIVALALEEATRLGMASMIPHKGSRVGRVFDSGEPYLSRIETDSAYYEDKLLLSEGMHTALVVPMRVDGKPIGTFNVNCRRSEGLSDRDVALLKGIGNQIAIAVANSQAYSRLKCRAEGLRRENERLQEIVHCAETATSLLLHSPSMRPLIDRLIAVAESDANVLLSGETGSGKGVLARALHAWSRRKDRPFVHIDCAATLPAAIERKLIGEATGAEDVAAEGSLVPDAIRGATVFLDRVSELPMETQARLLSVVPEHRVGQRRGTGGGDLRVIGSSNRSLRDEVEEGRFREDLYYRLNVVTFWVPPLRKRPLDIIPLAQHFLQIYGSALQRGISGLSPETERLLREHDWPGNIRELENLIERAILLHRGGGRLTINLEFLKEAADDQKQPDAQSTELASLSEVEARHIRRVLRATKGRIAGPRGAARVLGLHPSTLRSRMAKLKILVDKG